MRRKTSSRFPIPVKVGLKEASRPLSFVQIGKREEVFRRMFRRGPLLKITFQLHRNIYTVLLLLIQWYYIITITYIKYINIYLYLYYILL